MSAAPSPDALRLSNGVVDVTIPVAFGPRILGYGFTGEPSVLAEAPDATRDTPYGVWRAYGGHRLWAAPERFPETYTIDDRPPEIERHDERRVTLRRARDPIAGLRASMDVELAAAGTEVVVRHALRNDGASPVDVAAWGITVVRAGGAAVIPNAEPRPQREALQPVRTLTLWRYTDLADPRFTFGPRFVRLRCDPAHPSPNKIGAACERGWFAYVVDGVALVIRTPFDPDATYPDFGATVEVYSEGAFCEVETLGPLVRLTPGETARHAARWSLVRVEDDADAALAPLLAKHAGE